MRRSVGVICALAGILVLAVAGGLTLYGGSSTAALAAPQAPRAVGGNPCPANCVTAVGPRATATALSLPASGGAMGPSVNLRVGANPCPGQCQNTPTPVGGPGSLPPSGGAPGSPDGRGSPSQLLWLLGITLVGVGVALLRRR